MKVVIVAKTRMRGGACIGALTFDGRSLRLIAKDQETNNNFNMDYQVGEVWEVEVSEDAQITPPHVENVIVQRKRRLAPMMKIDQFIEKQMPPLPGGVEVIFDGLTQPTSTGTLYIAERNGLPSRSTIFWRPNQALRRDDDRKRIRYRYPTGDGGRTLTFVGFQRPVSEIPAGTLLRVSLAHWWRPREKPEGELRCYVQLSGWFPYKIPTKPQPVPAQRIQKRTYENKIPEIDQVLNQVFGYQDFRHLQREIIANIFRKQDSLAVMPTGSGKSLCYQLPATLLPGMTVVVSPLISLMEDQVLELREWGIPAVYLNSSLTHSQYLETLARIKSGQIKLLYAAPETLLRPETILLLKKCRVECFVIDEAHCISEWGHDFRPEYRQLAGLRAQLPQAVTLAVTATATQRVRQDIKKSLLVSDANEFISSFDRKNLVLSVVDKIDALEQTRDLIDAHKGQAGIIYCSTRDRVDTLSEQLQMLGYPVLPYHAGMESDARRRHQHRFRYEEGIIMVATIAFGMGINKSNVRFILHYNLPKNLENYYQQIGRAGRDGLSADCLMLYSYGDIATIRYFIEQEDPKRRSGSEHRLKTLLAYTDTHTCRRKPLLSYFGETYEKDDCEACDNCLHSGTEHLAAGLELTGDESGTQQVDLTTPARQYLVCVKETGEIFGMMHIINILRGSKSKKVLGKGHDRLSSYNIGLEYTKKQWRYLAGQFIRQGLLRRVQPHGSLELTSVGEAVLEGKKVWGVVPGYITKPTASKVDLEYDSDLFEQLRSLRTKLAGERELPPYVIFHDRTLTEMAAYYPRTSEDMTRIYGVGKHKLEQYGPHFLPVIKAYCKEKEIEPVNVPSMSIAQAKTARGRKRTQYIWERFQAGDSIQAIASELGFASSTILNHLKKAFVSGKPIRLDGLKDASELSQADEKGVMKAFEEFGTYRLRPVFDALDQTASYDQLHIWRLIYRITTE
ncbi:MAG: DNA helicase RecQ [Chloroflexota bacterium]|nr:DNA helicase RecQ [Chloroflexota bacterium]